MLILTALIVLYFLPSIVAKHTHNKRFNAVFILNVVAGWTVIGWAIALVWASTKI